MDRYTGGMSLLECLAYVAILAVVINLSMSAFVSASRLSSTATAGLNRLAVTDDLREGISRALREARGVAAGVGSYRTGQDTLVVELPLLPDKPIAHRYAVLGRIISKNRLTHMEVAEIDGSYTITWCSTYVLPVSAIRFGYDNADPLRARLISIEMDVDNVHKGKPPVSYRFSAALRSRAGGIGV
jgi:hypothetical protein